MNTKKVQWTLTSIISALSLFVTGVVVNAETYEVKNGDTLSEIAIKNNTTIEKLVELNQISKADLYQNFQLSTFNLPLKKEQGKNQNQN